MARVGRRHGAQILALETIHGCSSSVIQTRIAALTRDQAVGSEQFSESEGQPVPTPAV